MSTPDVDPNRSTGKARCQGWACNATKDVKLDHLSMLWLCAKCWARVDPRKYGKPPRK